MKSPLTNLRRSSFFLMVLLLPGLASAQVELSGSIADDTTGPLLSGQVYHLNGSVNVGSGKILTIQQGAIIKGRPASHLVVSGLLVVNGVPGNPVQFSSYTDDSVGGDTNLNGASSGTPGDWRGIYLYATATGSTISNAEFSYCGNANYSALAINGTGISIDQVNIQNCSNDAIDLLGQVTSVTNCGFYNNSGLPINSVSLQSLPSFSGNVASGNGLGDYLNVTSFSHTSDITIVRDNCIDDVVVVDMGSVNVAQAWQLNFSDGVIIKAKQGGTHFVSSGALNSMGLPGSPVVFTSLDDDSVGGDTANDGATAGTPGSWRGLYFYATAANSVIDNTIVQFAGGANYGAFTLGNCPATVTNCTVRDNAEAGFDLLGNSTGITISNCQISSNGAMAMTNVPLQAVPGFTNNQAFGNVEGDYIRVTSYSSANDVSIERINVLNDQLFMAFTSFNIGVNKRLTFGEGLIIKAAAGNHIVVSGELEVNGSERDPVIFTSINDDDYGGDTLKDGPTQGAPGHWRGMYFYSTAGLSNIDHAVIRFGGNANYAGITMSASALSVTNTVVRDGSNAGLDLLGSAGTATVSNCSFLNNAGIAAVSVPINSMPYFSGNTAQGNAGGDHTQVSHPVPTGNVNVEVNNVIGDLVHITGSPNISPGNSLTIGKGMVLKMNAGLHFVVSGGLYFMGTEALPVQVTSVFDDAVVGDTDMGATSTANPGDWRGIYAYATAQIVAQNTVMSYVGNANYPGYEMHTADVTLKRARVQHASADGFEFHLPPLTDPTHLTAYDCAGFGIDLIAGNFFLRRATVVENTLVGINARAGFTGSVVNSISRDNAGGNFAGFAPGEVTYCNGDPGFAGSDGNVDVDPMFADPLTGNFNLVEDSPCVDAGNPASPSDPDTSRADMGAHHFDYCYPKIMCGAKVNSQGCLPTMDWSGYPTASGDDNFHILAGDIIGQQPGYLLSSLMLMPQHPGQAGASLVGTQFCAFRPKFLVEVASGGTVNNCDGAFDVHYSQALMASEGLAPGTAIYLQYVYQDPMHVDGSTWGHTAALRFQICP